jgi:hypothetical protein
MKKGLGALCRWIFLWIYLLCHQIHRWSSLHFTPQFIANVCFEQRCLLMLVFASGKVTISYSLPTLLTRYKNFLTISTYSFFISCRLNEQHFSCNDRLTARILFCFS